MPGAKHLRRIDRHRADANATVAPTTAAAAAAPTSTPSSRYRRSGRPARVNRVSQYVNTAYSAPLITTSDSVSAKGASATGA